MDTQKMSGFETLEKFKHGGFPHTTLATAIPMKVMEVKKEGIKMTENYDKITAEYRDADFNHRLNMYLQFPQLRPKFILIDQNDLKTELSTGFKLRKNLLWPQMGMVLSLMVGSVKKILGIASA